MLGWEFPPYFAGGVGIVCSELTKTLAMFDGMEITYVMPYGPKESDEINGAKVLFANKFGAKKSVDVRTVNSTLYCYDSPLDYAKRYKKILETEGCNVPNKAIKQIYGENLLEEVYLYSDRVAALCFDMDFDIIHAHDWTTIPAALKLKELTGKPLILHVHITELDKTGDNGGHTDIMRIEREGFQGADVLIPVSHFTKRKIIEHYGADPNKIEVIHNGGSSDLKATIECLKNRKSSEKLVLFAGRITLQKGCEYFIKAAKRVLELEPNTKFVVAGPGDQLPSMIELAASLGIGRNVLFLGAYSREEADQLFGTADMFVMPSVSEPFGIVALEAVAKGTPIIISKQSGASEVLHNSFKVDFWDTEEMAHQIISLLRYPHLKSHMRKEAFKDYSDFKWEVPAKKLIKVYKKLIN